MAEKQVRVAVMGSGGVGKTSIIIRFGKNEFSQEWIPTLEDHFEAELSYKGMMYKLDIVDTAGQDELAAVVDMSIQGANVYICVCSVASRVTFDEIDTHIDRANKNDPTGKAKIVMVGNKCDLENRQVSEEEARAKGILSSVPASVDEDYYTMVISSLRRPDIVKGSPITVAYTPLHGSGNVPVREMLSRLGINCVVVKEQEEPDGAFPTVKLPNPESAEAMTRVIELAKKEKADIVIGTDPDADRMGLAIPTNAQKTDYMLLTGNQIATLLADYLLSTNREMGKRQLRPLVVKSLVTTDLVRRIALENGADCKDVLTGFKYIAREMNAIDKGENRDNFFLFGCEESYGFLTVNEVHDKDAVSSAMAAVEMMCYYASRGVTLQQRLDSIYARYGYSTELVFSRDYEGAEGKAKMASIMASLRALKPGDKMAERTIASAQDLLKEGSGFDKADVVILRFESGEKLVVRPSGTEQ